ncbi:type II secretion system-associated lipoprotein [Leptospira levettii]|uniref:Type II secretion system-associated lipoprotein n=1 Tax=Leptospira levettii TaxID=2023178 RepID=A0ABY2MKA7_9LEPT|nr:type II secretion system-associated lipoprotein [Leptospira levettii]PKA26985.1 type II secretion system-associated lipoprotein [Leptospira sp. mixed culture ATI2-C-A1]PJZ88473.1 type II secretion system-associated lipoprotein [Leptospira levettii]PKA00934.1 type II secretion system-associated lipoprotein [Leptospira levettii]TGK99782.1 type II secretion system-associated lipoprotein [Leptospira levettii]
MRVFPLVLVLVFSQCSQRLIKKEKLREINEFYDGKTYALRDDIKFSQTEVWKKGTLVKIYIESTPSLLKLKVYPIQESRESSVGKLADYIINDDVKKREYDLADVEEWVNQKFTLMEQNAKKTKK